MSIATEISRIQSAKTDIKDAIEAKGVTVPSSALIDTYDEYIDQIPTGGGNYDLSIRYSNTSIPSSACSNTSYYIEEIVIGSNITEISSYAFNRCTRLSAYTIPDSVTSIGSYAFQHCSGLTSVYIPSGVTTIGNYAFSDIKSATAITFAQGSQLTKINERAFSNTTKYPASVNVVLPEGLTTINKNAFTTTDGIATLVIPSTVTTIGNDAFRGLTYCTSITCLAETPPTIGTNCFVLTAGDYSGGCPIYVPAESVDTYKAANNWSSYAHRIQAIP